MGSRGPEAYPAAAHRTWSIAMARKMPNWTRLLTGSVKLGVSANHVIALRMAKLAYARATARAQVQGDGDVGV
jgi:hypothetical protein